MVHAHLPHFIQHGNRVDGLGEIEHLVDGFVNLPVLLQVEVLRLDNADNIRQATAVNQDRTQHGLLRLHGMGRLSGHQFIHCSVSSQEGLTLPRFLRLRGR